MPASRRKRVDGEGVVIQKTPGAGDDIAQDRAQGECRGSRGAGRDAQSAGIGGDLHIALRRAVKLIGPPVAAA